MSRRRRHLESALEAMEVRQVRAVVRTLACGLLLPLAFACGLPADPVQSTTQAIVGGVDDPDDPAVVALFAAGFCDCTGTLISPTAVVTAGHCWNVLGPNVPYWVAFGYDGAHPTERVTVIDQVRHPSFTGEGKPFDVAVMRLERPVTDVAPVPVGTTALTQADVGATVRHVGFGISDEAAATGRGFKRQVSYPITEVDAELVWSGGPGQQTCYGDSGGPALMVRGGGEELVGIVSDGPNCHDAGWDIRSDTVADWVSATIADWAPDAGVAPPPPRPGCASTGGLGGLLALAALLARARR